MTDKPNSYDKDITDFTSAILGAPPDDFNAKLKMAEKLLSHLMQWERDESDIDLDADTMIIASLAAYMNAGEKALNPTAFSIRVRQVVKWMTEPREELKARLDRMTEADNAGRESRADKELLENKLQEIARQVGMRLYKDEGFVLLIFNSDPGWVTHASSIERADQIKMLQQHLRWLVSLEDAKQVDA